MTALKPFENHRVRSVASERYPLNKVCAHPECAEPAVDPHHAVPRSLMGGSSWFVEIADVGPPLEIRVIPHVTGLCRAHHDDVEEHRAWIKLEDGLWLWYERGDLNGDWLEVGALNPQPGSVDGKPKKKRKRFAGDERRKRKTISIRVPNDTENGGELWDEMLENVRQRLIAAELYSESDAIPAYEAVMAAVNDWLTD